MKCSQWTAIIGVTNAVQQRRAEWNYSKRLAVCLSLKHPNKSSAPLSGNILFAPKIFMPRKIFSTHIIIHHSIPPAAVAGCVYFLWGVAFPFPRDVCWCNEVFGRKQGGWGGSVFVLVKRAIIWYILSQHRRLGKGGFLENYVSSEKLILSVKTEAYELV